MIEIYCDGSCRNNGHSNSAGGWCFAIIRDKDKLDISFSGAAENTTNNPKTSDNIVTFVAMFMVSVLGIAITVKYKKNKVARKH